MISLSHVKQLITLLQHPNFAMQQQLQVDHDLIEVNGGKCWHLASMKFMDTPISPDPNRKRFSLTLSWRRMHWKLYFLVSRWRDVSFTLVRTFRGKFRPMDYKHGTCFRWAGWKNCGSCFCLSSFPLKFPLFPPYFRCPQDFTVTPWTFSPSLQANTCLVVSSSSPHDIVGKLIPVPDCRRSIPPCWVLS